MPNFTKIYHAYATHHPNPLSLLSRLADRLIRTASRASLACKRDT
ncbi:hypothetical protein [Moraxella lacunata]